MRKLMGLLLLSAVILSTTTVSATGNVALPPHAIEGGYRYPVCADHSDVRAIALFGEISRFKKVAGFANSWFDSRARQFKTFQVPERHCSLYDSPNAVTTELVLIIEGGRPYLRTFRVVKDDFGDAERP